MYKKILGPLDGSAFSECSLEHIKAIATGCQVSEVVLLTVLEPVKEPFGGVANRQQATEWAKHMQKADKEAQQKAQDYLAKVAGTLKKQGITVQTIVIPADAGVGGAEGILDYARNNQVDLIVMSTHGRSGPSRWAFGSVADKIVRHAQVPVMTVAHPAAGYKRILMSDEPMLESTLLHLVKPEDLNHHGTLFAGQTAKWLIEAGFITAARLIGKPQDVVCVQVNSMTFKRPFDNGDLVEIKSRVAYLGSSSITVYSEAFRNREAAPTVTNMATFVTVNQENKPYKHGFKLSEEYIASNRDIYAEACKIRGAR